MKYIVLSLMVMSIGLWIYADNSDEYYESIGNGECEIQSHWTTYGTTNFVQGKKGLGIAISPDATTNYTSFISQPLSLTPNISAANFSFDYRFLSQSSTYQFQIFGVGIYKGYPLQPIFIIGGINERSRLSSEWLNFSMNISEEGLQILRNAQTSGQQLFLVILLQAQNLSAIVDNISFKVKSGTLPPKVNPVKSIGKGTIAYLGLDNSGYPESIKLIDSDGKNEKILWKHKGYVSQIYSMAWKPDGSLLAFSSNHESSNSLFNSDIYTVRPDGSDLRRITNSPSEAEINSGKYKMGSVKGRIYNAYGNPASFMVYIQGARKPVGIRTYFKETVEFTIDEVADLGPGVLQPVVFIWSGSSCAMGREFPASNIDIIAGETVEVNLQFNGYCNSYNITSISWGKDGSEIAFLAGGVPKIMSLNTMVPQDLFDLYPVGEICLSPIDDHILYHKSSGHPNGIFLTKRGVKEGALIIGSLIYTHFHWLPDGSGFIYLNGANIYQHIFATNEDIALTNFPYKGGQAMNLNVSPDGKYIAFEKVTDLESGKYGKNLWIFARDNPGNAWQITNDNKSSCPIWKPTY